MQGKQAIYRRDNCHLDSAVAGFGELESPERVVFGLPATNSDELPWIAHAHRMCCRKLTVASSPNWQQTL
jgi:hypothetical protein